MSTISLFDQLVEIMARLRDPEKGCPWDLQQNFRTIAPYTLEEAYEVTDAIDRDNMDDLCDELGDLLFQVVFHARLAAEQGYFTIQDICESINHKIKHRHPHIFAHEKITSAEAVSKRWDEIKGAERKRLNVSSMDGVAATLPALKYAQKIQRRAAADGFDWPDSNEVWQKLEEEKTELRQAVQSGDIGKIGEEVGDLLFTCVNLARHLGVDTETALRRSNQKFEQRYRYMELASRQASVAFESLDSQEKGQLWSQAKKANLH